MIGAEAPNPNCAYAWMDYITSPEAQAAVAEYFGEAPANTQGVRPRPRTRASATRTTPSDAAYAEQIHYWTTPIEQCLDGATRT